MPDRFSEDARIARERLSQEPYATIIREQQEGKRCACYVPVELCPTWYCRCGKGGGE